MSLTERKPDKRDKKLQKLVDDMPDDIVIAMEGENTPLRDEEFYYGYYWFYILKNPRIDADRTGQGTEDGEIIFDVFWDGLLYPAENWDSDEDKPTVDVQGAFPEIDWADEKNKFGDSFRPIGKYSFPYSFDGFSQYWIPLDELKTGKDLFEGVKDNIINEEEYTQDKDFNNEDLFDTTMDIKKAIRYIKSQSVVAVEDPAIREIKSKIEELELTVKNYAESRKGLTKKEQKEFDKMDNHIKTVLLVELRLELDKLTAPSSPPTSSIGSISPADITRTVVRKPRKPRSDKGVKKGKGILNPDLYEKAKEIVYKQYPKHSAYRSGQLVQKYKELGGKYSGTKPKDGLTRWYKEDWKDIGNKEYPVYRPTKRISKETPLTVSEIDPVQAKKQIVLKQKIKGEANLPPFEKKGKGNKSDKKLKPLFGRMGSKYTMIDEITSQIPPHTIYVEPFVGGGSIFWNKTPAEKSVINDLDKELIDGYRAFKKASLSSLQALDYLDSTLPKKDYKTEQYRNMIDKLETEMEAIKSQPAKQFIKMFKGSRGKFLQKSSGRTYFDVAFRPYIPNLEEYKRLLKDTIIENKNYVDIIKKYDSPTTFFFLDPPYEASEGIYKNHMIDYEQMRDILRNIKGKFLLTLNDSKELREIFREFQIKKASVKSTTNERLWKGGRNEIYISNYKVKAGGMMPPPPDSPTEDIVIPPPTDSPIMPPPYGFGRTIDIQPTNRISREQMRANVEGSRNILRETLAPTGYFAPIVSAPPSSNQPEIVRPTPVRGTPKRQIRFPITEEDIETANTMIELSKTGRGLEDYSNPKKVQANARKYLGKDVIVYPSTKKDKKYMIYTPEGKIVHFGSSTMEDFTKHNDQQRRASYLSRSAGIKGNWKSDKYSPNNLARQLLWNA